MLPRIRHGHVFDSSRRLVLNIVLTIVFFGQCSVSGYSNWGDVSLEALCKAGWPSADSCHEDDTDHAFAHQGEHGDRHAHADLPYDGMNGPFAEIPEKNEAMNVFEQKTKEKNYLDAAITILSPTADSMLMGEFWLQFEVAHATTNRTVDRNCELADIGYRIDSNEIHWGVPWHEHPDRYVCVHVHIP
jgi:hypothetical protein